MTYSGDSPIIGQGTVSAQAIDAWFRQYGTCPPGLGDAIVDACQDYASAVLNHDLVAAQIAHETGYWTSAIAKDKNNPAGLGAENDDPYNKAIAFPDLLTGIEAMCDHLLVYIKGDGDWAEHDPRYQAVKRAGWLGTVTTLNDLNGKWAYPGTTYGSQIANRANALVEFANHGSWNVAPDASYGPESVPTAADGFVSVDVLWAADRGPQRPLSDIKWGIVHKTEGNRAGDLPTLTAQDGNVASTHAWISRDGQVVWMVPLDITAWTPGNEFVAEHSINFELEGQEDEATTDAQYAALANLFRFAAKCGVSIPWEYVGKDERPGLIGHYDVGNPDWPHPGACGQWGGRSCHHDPGPLFDWPKLIAYLNSTSAPESTNVPPNATPSTNVPTVVLGFKGFYDGLGDKALRVLGLPLVNEFGWTEGGKQRSAQKFERGWLLWVPEHGSPWDIVVAPLVTIPELEARLAALGA